MPHPLQRRTLRTVATVQVLSGVGTAATVSAGSLLVTDLTGNEALAGLTQTFTVLGAAVMALPLAALTRRGGRRLALSAGYSTGALGALLAIAGGSTRQVLVLLIGACLVGAASASAYQARFAAVDLAEPQHRAKDLSFVVWGSTVGAVSGANLLAPSGTLARGLGLPPLTGPYLIALTMLALGTTVVITRLRPDPYLESVREAQATVQAVHMSPRDTLRTIAIHPRAVLGLAAVSIGHVAMISVMVMTPVHMKHVDVSLEIIGLVISVHVLGMYALSPLVGRYSDRFGRINAIAAGAIVLLVSALTAGTANNTVQLGIGLFLLGLGWSFTLVAGSTLLTESIDQAHKASVQGTSDLLMNLSGAGGGAIAGVIIAALSYGWLCAFMSIPVGLLLVSAVRQWRSTS